MHHGPEITPTGTRFTLWAPSCETIGLSVDNGAPQPMLRAEDGTFTLTSAAPAGARYQFRMPDGTMVPDPASRAQDGDVHGSSIVTDPAAYAWRHTEWGGRPWHEAIVYEAHPGLLGGFAGMREHLAYWAALGVTAIELMPVADFPGARGWGYDGVLPYAPDEAYGTPDDLKALIDDAHGHGLTVMLDVVYNHFGPDGAYIHTLAREFFREDKHTPWGAAIDFRRGPVRDFVIGNALYWLDEFRFDGLRFDAVSMYQDTEFLHHMAREIRARIPHDRHIALVVENENNEAAALAPGLYDAQWTDDFHHCMHVLLTGELDGYYASYEDAARLLARCLRDGFAFQGEFDHRGNPRGEPSAHLRTSAFCIFLQNHDQTGNRAMGERLAALAHPDALRAATVLLLLSPQIPMLFMGEEFFAQTPFLFFTDHHDELADLVREGRRREFALFPDFADPAKRLQIPDPNDADTYERSRPAAPAAAREAALALHRELIEVRKTFITPGIPGARALDAAAIGARAVAARWRLGTGGTLTIAANFDVAPVAMPHVAGELLYGSANHAALTAGDGALPGRATFVFLQP